MRDFNANCDVVKGRYRVCDASVVGTSGARFLNTTVQDSRARINALSNCDARYDAGECNRRIPAISLT